MSRRYTAQDMRIAAKSFLCSEVSLIDKRDIAEMLRQAAEMMEREKKYEYAVRTPTGWIDEEATQNTLEDIKLFYEDGDTIVRREVGEWEEVKE